MDGAVVRSPKTKLPVDCVIEVLEGSVGVLFESNLALEKR